MSQITKKPVSLPVRKRLKPAVNLNVACRRRKDTKDLSTADVTAEAVEVEHEVKIPSSQAKIEESDALPATGEKSKETSDTHVSEKKNESLLNTSFESKKSISSSVSTLLFQRDSHTDVTTQGKFIKILNESFESGDGCKSITSSISTVLVPDNENKKSSGVHVQSVELDEEFSGRTISNTLAENHLETHTVEEDTNTHIESHVARNNIVKSHGISESQQISRSDVDRNERSLEFQPYDVENVSRKSVSNIPGMVGHEGGTDSESVNDDHSSISEYSVREGSDLRLPKYKRKISSMAKRLSEAKRSFEARYSDKKPERSSLRMLDLIYYNPCSNPMKPISDKTNEVVVNSPSGELDSSQIAEEGVDNPDDDGIEGEENDNGIPAPRVKVGPNGEIVLDEQSLVIETTQSKKSRQEIANLTVVVDTGSSTTYHTYSKKKRSRSDWTVKETIRFYKALQTLGTDFSLMQTLFPLRSRLDLKSKFKKEEKINGDLIEKALRFPSLFDISELEKDQTNEENKRTLAVKQKTTQKRPKKRSLKSLGFDEEDNGPALKKKKRRKVKTLAQRNRGNDAGRETTEGKQQISSSDEEYQPPARDQKEFSEGTHEASERRSNRVKRGVNGKTPNYVALENKHDFLEAGVDLLESSDAEEENDPLEESEAPGEIAPVGLGNFSMDNVQPGSLVIVTAQCPNNPGYQICNVFMVQERSDSENVSPTVTTDYFPALPDVPHSSTETTEGVAKPS